MPKGSRALDDLYVSKGEVYLQTVVLPKYQKERENGLLPRKKLHEKPEFVNLFLIGDNFEKISGLPILQA